MQILIIDDDEEDVEFFTDALQEIDEECECISASSCEKGLTKLAAMQKPPGFIFLDGMLYGMSSKDCLTRLKANRLTRDIHVIIYSGYLSPEAEQDFLKSGAHLYLKKPSNRRDLISALKKIFNQT